MIAPALCAYNARLALSRWEQSSRDIENNLIFFLYEEDDLIHGAGESIRQALIDICQRGTFKVLFVVTSCLPEIVGEDVEAVVRQLRDLVSVPVLLIKTENFTDMTARLSQANALLSFLDLMEHPREHIQKSVNIIGSSARDFPSSELSSVLQEAGYSINTVFPSGCDLDRLKKASRAEYNVLLTRNATLLAEKMQAEFCIPFYLFDAAYSPQAISDNYAGLGTFLGCDLLPSVAARKDGLTDAIQSARDHLEGSSIIISLSNSRVFDMATLLYDVGMYVPLIGFNQLTTTDLSDASRLSCRDSEILTINNLSISPLDECIATIRPNYYLSFGNPDAIFCARNGVRARRLVSRPHPNGFDAGRRILEILSKDKPGLSTLVLREQMREKAGIL